jgi:hypothetical protein
VSTLCGLLSPDHAENLDVSTFTKFHIMLDLVHPKICTREITVYHGDTNQHKTYVVCYLYNVKYKVKLDTAEV